MTLSKPRDLQIVCGIYSLEQRPEVYIPNDEVVLDIVEIINHPDYSPEKGPLHGGDIAVYKVNETQMTGKLERKKLYPACLPRSTYEYKNSIIVK